jgi:hypothetical protein
LNYPRSSQQPTRLVYQADAFAWMNEHPVTPWTSVITSLPDVSELSHFDLAQWKDWFITAARSVIRWVGNQGVIIFYQSDIRHDNAWIDKGYLVLRAAEAEQVQLVWHKIVCRRPPLTVAIGRPSFSHMLCLSAQSFQLPVKPGPDVLPDAGYMPWSRAMGVKACEVACQFIRDETPTRVIVDPFCGQGTVLAVANHFGFDAVGVDLGARRCKIARNLCVECSGSAG